mmetsp:Transcript_34859/g.105098  ORF Transcript_34859/g.105098 Transcript_34859/m.105098 type:complete len:284 (-) Transcript_34859:7-858(-)
MCGGDTKPSSGAAACGDAWPRRNWWILCVMFAFLALRSRPRMRAPGNMAWSVAAGPAPAGADSRVKPTEMCAATFPTFRRPSIVHARAGSASGSAQPASSAGSAGRNSMRSTASFRPRADSMLSSKSSHFKCANVAFASMVMRSGTTKWPPMDPSPSSTPRWCTIGGVKKAPTSPSSSKAMVPRHASVTTAPPTVRSCTPSTARERNWLDIALRRARTQRCHVARAAVCRHVARAAVAADGLAVGGARRPFELLDGFFSSCARRYAALHAGRSSSDFLEFDFG